MGAGSMRDYQTATGVVNAAGKADLERTVVSPRYYLSDAAFLIGLEGADRPLLLQIHTAPHAPVWPLALGRKAFVPGESAWLPDALREAALREALATYPRLAQPDSNADETAMRLILEHPNTGAVRMDQPIAPFAARSFGPRYVAAEVIDVPV